MKKTLTMVITATMATTIFLTACSKPAAPAPTPMPNPAPGVAAPAPAPQEKKYNFKLFHHVPAKHSVDDYGNEFAKLINDATGGNVVVEVFPGGQIGGLKDNADGVRMGTIDFAMIDGATISSVVPRAGVMGLPYLFKDLEQAESFYGSDAFKNLKDEIIEKADTRFLGMSHSGMRVMLTTRPINSVADMKLLKIRVPEVPVYLDTMKALNANPTPMPSGEIYTSLQTGVIEGCELPPDTLCSLKLFEVGKFVAPTNHIYTEIGLSMSEKLYQSLSDDLQKKVTEAGETATMNHRKLAGKLYDDFYAQILSNDVKETTPNAQEFKEAVAPVWEKFETNVSGGKELIAAINSFAK